MQHIAGWSWNRVPQKAQVKEAGNHCSNGLHQWFKKIGITVLGPCVAEFICKPVISEVTTLYHSYFVHLRLKIWELLYLVRRFLVLLVQIAGTDQPNWHGGRQLGVHQDLSGKDVEMEESTKVYLDLRIKPSIFFFFYYTCRWKAHIIIKQTLLHRCHAHRCLNHCKSIHVIGDLLLL